MYSSTSLCVSLATVALVVSGQLTVNNKCGYEVYVWSSNKGDCDKGPNSICHTQPGAEPWTMGKGAEQSFQFIANNEGTSLKFQKKKEAGTGSLQFEYCLGDSTGGMFWDLSDLDGAGGNRVGTPFASDNVVITPTGPGVGSGTCKAINCVANEVCWESYQFPDQTATRNCPSPGAAFTLDLCEPGDIKPTAGETGIHNQNPEANPNKGQQGQGSPNNNQSQSQGSPDNSQSQVQSKPWAAATSTQYGANPAATSIQYGAQPSGNAAGPTGYDGHRGRNNKREIVFIG